MNCCACSSVFFCWRLRRSLFLKLKFDNLFKSFGIFWVYNVLANNWIWFQIFLVLTSIMEKLLDNRNTRQGDQRQEKSGNFNVPFLNQGKSGEMALFGENQGIIREFHYESGKKSGNFFTVFICYFV